ncbi:MAG: DUF695 domain-containing protein, partial [Candidatus Saccharimonas sp.]|nr:DUF695 domain-containing protein [Planctomycetaceae bacterium]
AQGEGDGKPMIVRVNSSAKEYAGHPDLPVRLGVAIPLHAPRPDGLPNEAESEQLGDIEDRLFDAIGTAGRVVLIITTSGMREFVSYVRTADAAEQVAQSVRTATATHELQHYAENDPKWCLFGQFA